MVAEEKEMDVAMVLQTEKDRNEREVMRLRWRERRGKLIIWKI